MIYTLIYCLLALAYYVLVNIPYKEWYADHDDGRIMKGWINDIHAFMLILFILPLALIVVCDIAKDNIFKRKFFYKRSMRTYAMYKIINKYCTTQYS